MLSLLPSRIAARTLFRTHTIASLSRANITQSQSSRRTFLTTSRVFEPAAKTASTKATKAVAKKTPVKKATTAAAKTATTTKKPAATKTVAAATKRVVKKKAAPKKKVAAVKYDTTRANGPPSAPGNPFIIFYNKYRQGEPTPTSRDQATEMTKHAARMWANMTEAEKQPFKDEYQTALKDHAVKRNEWYDNVDPKFLKAYNAKRTKVGKTKVVIPREMRKKGRPTTPFFRFLAEFRNSPEALDAAKPDGGRLPVVDIAKAAGAKWRSMSPAELDPYTTPAKQDMLEWKESRAAASAP